MSKGVINPAILRHKKNKKTIRNLIWVINLIQTDQRPPRNPLATDICIVDVFSADLFQSIDELIKCIPVNHQTAHSIGIVSNDIGRSYIFAAKSKWKRIGKSGKIKVMISNKRTYIRLISLLPLEGLFTEEISSFQRTNVDFLGCDAILNGDFNLTQTKTNKSNGTNWLIG